METVRIIAVESDHKIQIPSEWAAELQLDNVATLERTAQGILVRPYPPSPRLTWEQIFANKLTIGSRSPESDVPESDSFELSGDDLLF